MGEHLSRRCSLAAILFLAPFTSVLAFAGSAEATARIQGVGEASVGYTDNIRSTPSVAGSGEKEGGVLMLASPGVVLALVTPRYVQRLGYTYTYDFFVANTTASTSSNQLSYLGFFDVSPRLGLILTATAIQSNRYSALVVTAPGAGAANALPPGSGSFLSASASELLSFEAAPDVRLYESLAVTEQTPLFDTVAPRTFAPSARLGAERSWQTDALGGEARADYSIVTGAVRPDGTPLGEQRELIGAGVGTWRHDYGREFTSRVEAGVLRAERLNTGRGLWQPTGSATLAFVTEAGDAEATYRHTVTVNPLLGQTLLVDEMNLRGAVPLTKKGEVVAAASVGYQRGRILDEDMQVAAHVNVLLTDVALGYRLSEPLLLGIRYQHIDQTSDVTAPPLPLGYARNTVLLGLTVRFPPESEMPRGYRAPRRVDRTDEIRDGLIAPAPSPTGEPNGVNR